MTQFVAFLRAINVGGHTVKMDILRQLFEALDLSNVETFIASGNVIFQTSATAKTAATLERKIEKHLEQALGYPVATFLRSVTELASIAQYKPFSDAEIESGAMLYVAFVAQQPSAAVQAKLMAMRNEADDFHFHQREIYWLCRKNFHESKFSGGLLEKTLGVQATVRNSTTVKKLAAKYGVM